MGGGASDDERGAMRYGGGVKRWMFHDGAATTVQEPRRGERASAKNRDIVMTGKKKSERDGNGFLLGQIRSPSRDEEMRGRSRRPFCRSFARRSPGLHWPIRSVQPSHPVMTRSGAMEAWMREPGRRLTQGCVVLRCVALRFVRLVGVDAHAPS